MSETVVMLGVRLSLLDHVRAVEHSIARAEHARAAASLVRSISHELGNSIEVVKIAAEQLVRRGAVSAEPARTEPELDDLLGDLARAGERAVKLVTDLYAAARPVYRTEAGASLASTIAAAVDRTRPALAAPIAFACAIDDAVRTACTAEELDALVFALLLDASTATRVELVVRERVIEGRRKIEILRTDDRDADGDFSHAFDPPALLHVVAATAEQVGGNASIAPGRTGRELAIELPRV